MSQPPYPSGPGQPPQNPYQQNPYQQSPGGFPAPPQKSNNTKTVLIILGIVGGVIVASVLICGIFGFLAFRNATDQFAGMVEEMQVQMEQMKKAEANYWADTYRENEVVKEKIGTISSQESKSSSYSESGPTILYRIRITGEKGTGVLEVEQAEWDFEKMDEDGYAPEIKTWFSFEGERVLIDDDAESENDAFDSIDYEDFEVENDSESGE